jgi:hypothetical protein
VRLRLGGAICGIPGRAEALASAETVGVSTHRVGHLKAPPGRDEDEHDADEILESGFLLMKVMAPASTVSISLQARSAAPAVLGTQDQPHY